MDATPAISPFWLAWMRASAGGVILFSAFMILVPDGAHALFNWLIFGDPATPIVFPQKAVAYIGFTYGVLGAVMTGWMVALLMVIEGPFKRGDPFGWTVIAGSLGAWYMIDTPYSLATGYWPNAVLNTIVFVAFAVPLYATYAAFQKNAA